MKNTNTTEIVANNNRNIVILHLKKTFSVCKCLYKGKNVIDNFENCQNYTF